MPSFVTIFEKSENVHLIKDVGQIPYQMHRLYGYDATLVTYQNDRSYDYLAGETPGLQLHFVPKVKFWRVSLSVIIYLWKHAPQIDVLHLFHHREKAYTYLWVYKWRNPKGFVYLKSDMATQSLVEHQGLLPKKRWIRRWLFEKVKGKIDLVSFESEDALPQIARYHPEIKARCIHLPNGLDFARMEALAPRIGFDAKAKIILTVGRIGAPEKNHGMLLEVISQIDLKGLQVVFVGPVEAPFQKEIDTFFTHHPALQNTVIFTGAIYDRNRLFDWYARSRVFCLTSLSESFGFVLIEAMAYGCDIITTPISSARSITENETVGYIAHDVDTFAGILQNAIDETLLGRSEAVVASAQSRFGWERVLTSLQERIIEAVKVK